MRLPVKTLLSKLSDLKVVPLLQHSAVKTEFVMKNLYIDVIYYFVVLCDFKKRDNHLMSKDISSISYSTYLLIV